MVRSCIPDAEELLSGPATLGGLEETMIDTLVTCHRETPTHLLVVQQVRAYHQCSCGADGVIEWGARASHLSVGRFRGHSTLPPGINGGLVRQGTPAGCVSDCYHREDGERRRRAIEESLSQWGVHAKCESQLALGAILGLEIVARRPIPDRFVDPHAERG